MGGFCRQSSSSLNRGRLSQLSSLLIALSSFRSFTVSPSANILPFRKSLWNKAKASKTCACVWCCPRMNDSHRRGRDANSFLPEGTNNKQTTGHHRLRLKASSESLYGILEKSLLWEYGACNYY